MEAAKNMLMKDMGHAVVQPKEQIPRTETSAEIKAAAIRTMADCSRQPTEAAKQAAIAKASPAVQQAISQAKENIERREQEKQREAELTERKNQKRQAVSKRLADEQRTQTIEAAMKKRAAEPKAPLVKQNWIDALNHVGISPSMSDENGEKMTLQELQALAYNRGCREPDVYARFDHEFRQKLEAETKPPRFVAVPDRLLEQAEAEAVAEVAAEEQLILAQGGRPKDPVLSTAEGRKSDPRQPTPEELAEALKALGMTATPATDLNADEIAAFKKAGIYSEESVDQIRAKEAQVLQKQVFGAQVAAGGADQKVQPKEQPKKPASKKKSSKKKEKAALKSGFFDKGGKAGDKQKKKSGISGDRSKVFSGAKQLKKYKAARKGFSDEEVKKDYTKLIDVAEVRFLFWPEQCMIAFFALSNTLSHFLLAGELRFEGRRGEHDEQNCRPQQDATSVWDHVHG